MFSTGMISQTELTLMFDIVMNAPITPFHLLVFIVAVMVPYNR